jgi:starch phosphorylase
MSIFTAGDGAIFQPIREALLNQGDYYLHLADFASYVSRQKEVGQTFLKKHEWSRKAILNIARMSKFSSDRAIREYASDIWNIRAYRPRNEA